MCLICLIPNVFRSHSLWRGIKQFLKNSNLNQVCSFSKNNTNLLKLKLHVFGNTKLTCAMLFIYGQPPKKLKAYYWFYSQGSLLAGLEIIWSQVCIDYVQGKHPKTVLLLWPLQFWSVLNSDKCFIIYKFIIAISPRYEIHTSKHMIAQESCTLSEWVS